MALFLWGCGDSPSPGAPAWDGAILADQDGLADEGQDTMALPDGEATDLPQTDQGQPKDMVLPDYPGPDGPLADGPADLTVAHDLPGDGLPGDGPLTPTDLAGDSRTDLAGDGPIAPTDLPGDSRTDLAGDVPLAPTDLAGDGPASQTDATIDILPPSDITPGDRGLDAPSPGPDQGSDIPTDDMTLPADLTVPPPDRGDIEPGPCSPLDQNCPAGQKCSLVYEQGGLAVDCTDEGPWGENQSCGYEGWDDCRAGLVCANVDGAGFICMPLCEPQSPTTGCAAREACLAFQGTEHLNVGVCVPSVQGCRVVEQDCPNPSDKCTFTDIGLECMPAGAVGEGQTCSPAGADDCQAGLYCLTLEDVSTCVPLCNPLRHPSGCASGDACYTLTGHEADPAGLCLPFPSSCSLADQDCPDQEKCSITNEGIACIGAGSVLPGQPCGAEGTDDCQTGLICVDQGDGLVCSPVCEPDSDPTGCDLGALCFHMANLDSINGGFCRLFVEECSIRDQDCPDPQDRCSLTMEGLECVLPGPGDLGDPCLAEEECGTGLICIGMSTIYACRQACEPDSDPTGCPDGQPCVEISGLWDVNVGICQLTLAECSVNGQDCLEGEKCTFTAQGLECQDDGTLGPGVACGTEGVDDCSAGLICAQEDDGFTCQDLCEPWTIPSGCETGYRCSPLPGAAELNVGLCMTYNVGCSPRDQDCPDGERCMVSGGDLACILEGDVGADEPCGDSGLDDCQAGLICISYMGFSTCEGLCEPDSSPWGCDMGVACERITGLQDLNIGVCDPLAPDCSIRDQDCPDGLGCTFDPERSIACMPLGEGGLNDPCSTGQCGLGLLCVSMGAGGSTCEAMCEPYSQPQGCANNAPCALLAGLEMFNVGVCLAMDCSVLDQDCSDGDKCTFTGMGIECQDEGPMGLDQPCGAQGVDDCQAGLFCNAESDTCMALCEPDSAPNGCEADDSCVRLTSTFNVGLCMAVGETCGVLAQDCPDGEKCTLSLYGLECFPDGTRDLDQTCDSALSDNCQAGLLCASTGGAPTCMALCEPQTSPSGCVPGELCLLIQGYEGVNVGVCWN